MLKRKIINAYRNYVVEIQYSCVIRRPRRRSSAHKSMKRMGERRVVRCDGCTRKNTLCSWACRTRRCPRPAPYWKLLKIPDAPDVPDAFPCVSISYVRRDGDRSDGWWNHYAQHCGHPCYGAFGLYRENIAHGNDVVGRLRYLIRWFAIPSSVSL